MRRGTNLPRVGDYNQRVILDCIRRRPDGVSRVEIAELTGLSPQTASNITRPTRSQERVTPPCTTTPTSSSTG